ncbi:MAG: hypothetical protein KGJ79_10605 [Alphaproteobacteria bacterium]|nr:hypothetical protein [Alphaproteobacteria bacterium]MDE2493486.1 hypothetical protein [Alphaproteobacteria bacterium]
MSHAGWNALWHQALVLLSTESIQVRILIGLGVAFTALMIVEGLRVSFLPRARRGSGNPAASAPAEDKAVKKAEGTVQRPFEAASPYRPRGKNWASNPKRLKGRISRHRAERPKIRRMPADPTQTSSMPAPGFTKEAGVRASFPPNPG